MAERRGDDREKVREEEDREAMTKSEGDEAYCLTMRGGEWGTIGDEDLDAFQALGRRERSVRSWPWAWYVIEPNNTQKVFPPFYKILFSTVYKIFYNISYEPL